MLSFFDSCGADAESPNDCHNGCLTILQVEAATSAQRNHKFNEIRSLPPWQRLRRETVHMQCLTTSLHGKVGAREAIYIPGGARLIWRIRNFRILISLHSGAFHVLNLSSCQTVHPVEPCSTVGGWSLMLWLGCPTQVI